MIFCYKPYYNPNYINLHKCFFNDICPKPKKLCKTYKLYNAKQIFFQEHKKKIKKPNFKAFKL
jgi:hypothetical protein